MVLVAAVVRILQTRGLAAPVVLCDEFIYANLAKNLADQGHPLPDVTLHQSLLYPLLIAPAWFADSAMGALAKGIASAMALTAVPVISGVPGSRSACSRRPALTRCSRVFLLRIPGGSRVPMAFVLATFAVRICSSARRSSPGCGLAIAGCRASGCRDRPCS
jgi:hypothetical protein